jgi:hypothetical protein
MGDDSRIRTGCEYPFSRWRGLASESELAPTLLTVVSTEEEFDWNQPFDSRHRTVRSAERIPLAQELFDSAGVRPVYVVDHPIASTEGSIAALRPIVESGRCEIGAHLHPWVNPPLDESPSPDSSYPGNLPRELERAKLSELVAVIEQSFGVRPRTYQAGRYGFGAATAALIEELGFDVDLSASPAFDYSADGGPDYRRMNSRAGWFGVQRRLLSIPVTGAYLGYARKSGPVLHGAASRRPWRWLRAPGLLARAGAVERVRLSPEGFDLGSLRRVTRQLHSEGSRVFVLGLHSPSFLPGCTPYVRDDADLRRFMDLCRDYYDFFARTFGGRHCTATELFRELSQRETPSA